MNKSETISELAKALVGAQKAITGAKLDSENPYFHSKYADLTSIWASCRKPLSDNGLSIVQSCDIIDGQSVIETTLLHTSGEWITGKLVLSIIKPDPQSMGSAITYARRYSLAAMVGICTEDDDAESAMDRKKDTPMVEEAKNIGAVKKEHWCEEHQTYFFKRGKMKSYAHPIEGTDKWCYESKHKEEPTHEEKEPAEPGQMKTPGDFLNRCLKEFKMDKTQVETAIGTKIEDLTDYEGAFVFLRDSREGEYAKS